MRTQIPVIRTQTRLFTRRAFAALQTRPPQCGTSVARPEYVLRKRRGAAAVEFAIVLPVLVTILIGTTDFGRFYYSAIAVTNAARAGAAYGCMNPPSDANSAAAWQTGVTSAVTDELTQSSTAFNTANVTVTSSSVTESSGLTRVSVQVSYPFTTIVSWSYVPSSFTLTQTVVLRGIR